MAGSCIARWFINILSLLVYVAAEYLPIAKHRNLSVSDFQSKFSQTSIPVVLEGAASSWDAMRWDIAALQKRCGGSNLEACQDGTGKNHMVGMIKVYNASLQGKAWGSMSRVVVPEYRKQHSVNLTTLSDMFRLQREGHELYLNDASIDILCPRLFEELQTPAYFRSNLQLLIPDSLRALDIHLCPSSTGGSIHPSLFVGKAGSQTGLHIDDSSTRFWMAVLKGTKIFRLAHPEDLFKLYPIEPLDPEAITVPTTFHADLFNPDHGRHPLLKEVRIYEVEVSEGDIMFIPEEWPHQVVNKDDTIAVSYNFVDDANFLAHLQYLSHLACNIEDEELQQQAKHQVMWMHSSAFTQLRTLDEDKVAASIQNASWAYFFEQHQAKRRHTGNPFRTLSDEEIVHIMTLGKGLCSLSSLHGEQSEDDEEAAVEYAEDEGELTVSDNEDSSGDDL